MTSTHPPDYIIGSDEVGYGAWAGPLVVCAVAVPRDWAPPEGLTDSKALSAALRRALYSRLYELPCALIGVPNYSIDLIGVGKALLRAHEAAVRQMLVAFPDADVVVDGAVGLPNVPQARAVPKADATIPAVSAASVIAKENRDHIMRKYHLEFPVYGFDTNVGYGTKEHEHGLLLHGTCPIHRRSYRPVQRFR